MQDKVDRGDGPGDEHSFDRRRGPRRVGDAAEFPAERRQDDRRSLLGWTGLLADVADAVPASEDVPAFDRRKAPRSGRAGRSPQRAPRPRSAAPQAGFCRFAGRDFRFPAHSAERSLAETFDRPAATTGQESLTGGSSL
jgi:hypothetical protein